MSTTKKTTEQNEALTRLRALLQPGDTVYTTLVHVSRSGMHRLINVNTIIDNQPQWLSGYIARAGLFTLDSKRDALRVGGCGMDMGFHVVYRLSAALWPDGFGCIGQLCPSNDHFNGDRGYTPHKGVGGIHAQRAHWHKSGGYALQQRWM